MEACMSKFVAALAILALISSVTMAEARGGRTTVEDCDAGSADPDCPDAPAPPTKPPPPPPAAKSQQSTPAPPPK
jgi:hypothetical protein